MIRVPGPQGFPDTGASPVAGESAGDVEDEVLPKATGNELCQVFRGLVEGSKTRPWMRRWHSTSLVRMAPGQVGHGSLFI